MLNMLINILQPTHPDDIKSWLVYAPEKGTEFFFLLKYWTYMYLDLVRLVVFLHHQQKKKQETENSNERKFVWSFLLYAVFIWFKCPGHLLNFWTFSLSRHLFKAGCVFKFSSFSTILSNFATKCGDVSKKHGRFVRGWALINFSCLSERRLFEPGWVLIRG